jgi:hypothetical protein
MTHGSAITRTAAQSLTAKSDSILDDNAEYSASVICRSGWTAAVLVISATLMPQSARWGMFFDGVCYATISRNLAVGVGSCWEPHFTDYCHSTFHDSLPLALIIQSIAFRVLGEHYLVEKAYSLFTMLATLCLIPPAWRILTAEVPSIRRQSWLPVLLWVSIPSWSWAYSNNLLENTMGAFCLLAFLMALRALGARSSMREIAWCAASATVIVAAFFSKGPVGLFPITAACIVELALARGRLRRGIRVSLFTAVAVGMVLGILLTYEPIRNNVSRFLEQQLFPALTGQRRSGNRWELPGELLRQLWPMLVVLAIALLVAGRRRRLTLISLTLRPALACWLVAFSASLPIMVSYRFTGLYLFPSLPYFALGVALAVAPILLSGTLSRRTALSALLESNVVHRSTVAVILILLVLSFCLIGTPHRDRDLFHELGRLQSVVPRGDVIGASRHVRTDHMLHAVLHRYQMVSIDTHKSSRQRKFYLAAPRAPLPAGFRPTGITLRNRQLGRSGP